MQCTVSLTVAMRSSALIQCLSVIGRAKPPEVQTKDGRVTVSISLRGYTQIGELVKDLVAALGDNRLSDPSDPSKSGDITIEVRSLQTILPHATSCPGRHCTVHKATER